MFYALQLHAKGHLISGRNQNVFLPQVINIQTHYLIRFPPLRFWRQLGEMKSNEPGRQKRSRSPVRRKKTETDPIGVASYDESWWLRFNLYLKREATLCPSVCRCARERADERCQPLLCGRHNTLKLYAVRCAPRTSCQQWGTAD